MLHVDIRLIMTLNKICPYPSSQLAVPAFLEKHQQAAGVGDAQAHELFEAGLEQVLCVFSNELRQKSHGRG